MSQRKSCLCVKQVNTKVWGRIFQAELLPCHAGNAHLKQSLANSLSAHNAAKWANNMRALSSLSSFCLWEKSQLHSSNRDWKLNPTAADELFVLYLNFCRLELLSKTDSGFCNENPTLQWHLMEGMGRDGSWLIFQRHHSCFSASKIRKQFLCSVVFQSATWGSTHLSMLLFIKAELAEADAAPYG